MAQRGLLSLLEILQMRGRVPDIDSNDNSNDNENDDPNDIDIENDNDNDDDIENDMDDENDDILNEFDGYARTLHQFHRNQGFGLHRMSRNMRQNMRHNIGYNLHNRMNLMNGINDDNDDMFGINNNINNNNNNNTNNNTKVSKSKPNIVINYEKISYLNLPQLPKAMRGIGLIMHPMDSNLLLLHGSVYNNNIYIYNINNKSYFKVSDKSNYNKLFESNYTLCCYHMCISGNKPGTLLSIGGNSRCYQDWSHYIVCDYNQNTDHNNDNNNIIDNNEIKENKENKDNSNNKKDFRFLCNLTNNDDNNIININNNNTFGVRAHEYASFKHCYRPGGAIRYKNFLFISHKDDIFVYSLNYQTQIPKYIGNISDLPNHYKYHGSIILSNKNNGKNDGKNDNNNEIVTQSDTIHLMLFGGGHASFFKSFISLKIEITVKNPPNNLEVDLRSHEFNYKLSYSLEHHPSGFLANEINDKLSSLFNLNDRFHSFSYYLTSNEKYLIIMGGMINRKYNSINHNWSYHHQNNNINNNNNKKKYLTKDVRSNKIIYYSFESKEWFISDKELPIGISNHSSIVLKNINNEYFIHIMGGYNNDDILLSIHWKIRLNDIWDRLSWTIERLIWMAYFKNIQNNQCKLSIDKAILLQILSFLK